MEDKQKIDPLGVWYLQTSCREHLALPAARLSFPAGCRAGAPAGLQALSCSANTGCPAPASLALPLRKLTARPGAPAARASHLSLSFYSSGIFPLTCCNSRTSTRTPLSVSLSRLNNPFPRSPPGVLFPHPFIIFVTPV